MEVTLPLSLLSPPVPSQDGSSRHINNSNRRRYRFVCMMGTYGCLEEINRVVAETKADCVLHCGNFGFYDVMSGKRLSRLQLLHVWEGKRNLVPRQLWAPPLTGSLDDKQATLLDYFTKNPMSSLGNYVPKSSSSTSSEPISKFSVPVLTVWGGREDLAVVEAFRDNRVQVPNLHVLSAAEPIVLNLPISSENPDAEQLQIVVYGMGGDSSYERLFNLGDGSEQCSGVQGFLWYNLLQLGSLLEAHFDLQKRTAFRNTVRLFLATAPLGRDPLLFLIARELDAMITVSSNQKSRATSMGNPYRLHSVTSFREWMGDVSERLERACQRIIFDKPNDVTERELYLTQLALNTIKKQAESIVSEDDLKRTFMVGITEVHDGYCVINVDAFSRRGANSLTSEIEGFLGMESVSRGFHFSCQSHSPEKPIRKDISVGSNFPIPHSHHSGETSPTLSSSLHSCGGEEVRKSEMAETNFKGSAIFVIQNIPGSYFQTEQSLFTELLEGKYDIKSLRFYSPRLRESIRGECTDEATAIRLVADLDGLVHEPTGAQLRCSRIGAGVQF